VLLIDMTAAVRYRLRSRETHRRGGLSGPRSRFKTKCPPATAVVSTKAPKRASGDRQAWLPEGRVALRDSDPATAVAVPATGLQPFGDHPIATRKSRSGDDGAIEARRLAVVVPRCGRRVTAVYARPKPGMFVA
jgi:hypothetical protein